MLKVEHLTVDIGNHRLLSDVSFHLSEKNWIMVAGPNGAGKSTLIKALSGTLGCQGQIYLMGNELKEISVRERARILGVLAQQHDVNYSFSVEEVVRLGRYCHAPRFWEKNTDQDEAQVQYALEMTGMWEQRKQSVLTISGGELQRVFLAQLFAQNPRILLLDEPTNHLDISYQAQLFPMIQEWLDEGGRAVLSVVHDLGLARRFGNQALLLHKGQIMAYGEKEEVFQRDNLIEAYGIDVGAWMQQLYEPWTQNRQG